MAVTLTSLPGVSQPAGLVPQVVNTAVFGVTVVSMVTVYQVVVVWRLAVTIPGSMSPRTYVWI
ncbi:MAG TPA: hypothetical protein VG267_21905 [Terracidiphilus sp.]|nr:hypothetical protein [Terracidiphilus sp.]